MDKTLSILILEDNVVDAELMERELRKAGLSFSSKRVETKKAFVNELEGCRPDLILSDYNLPAFDGMSALAIAKEKCPDIPFIFVSGSLGEELAIETLRMGATDYVLKDRLSRLVPAVQRALSEAKERAERKRAEQQLAGEREKLSVTLKSISDGVILIDHDKRVVLANPAGKGYLKLLAGANVGDVLVHLGERPLYQLLEPPKENPYHELTLGNSPQHILEVTPEPIEGESRTDGWVLVIRDVTEERTVRKHAETQERLAAVGQLAAGIAHDFNNALTVIIGFSELLKRDPNLTDKAAEKLDSIIQQGYRSSRLVKQILDFSRQSVLKKHPLDLSPLLKENIRLLERVISENIRISINITPGNYWILADSSQIQQILANLLLNSRDAMPGGGEVKIRLTQFHLREEAQPPFPQMPSGDWLMLSIADTGTGIEPKHLPHIFEPFFTTKERGAGTGLGLAQVYGLVKQHGGFIDVASEWGKGTEFTIYLPIISKQRVIVPREQKEEEEKVVYGEGETILLVEDDPSVLETNKLMLEDLRYRVLGAKNGQEALKIYDQYHKEISIVLTDAVMPRMDGVTLLQELSNQNPDIKALVITGYPIGEETRKTLIQGTVDWIQKPINLSELSQAVGRVLGKVS